LKHYEVQRGCEAVGAEWIPLDQEKGSVRYYGKPGVDTLIRVDYHGSKEIPTGTCNAILKAAGLK